MNSPLQPFLDRCFSRHFTHYRPEWIALALEIVEEERELIAADLHVMYPPSETPESLGERLAEVAEFDTTFLGTLLHRIQNGIFRKDPLHPSLPFFAQLMKARTGMEISCSTEIGPRFVVVHGFGIFIGPRHRIGSDFTIYQGAAIGERVSSPSEQRIVIGDHCILFAGAMLSGELTVGDHVTIGTHSILTQDAEAGATYAGTPAIRIKGGELS